MSNDHKAQDGSVMSLAEARAIIYMQDADDPARALEAIATVLRFNAISEPKLQVIAVSLEQIAKDIATGITS